MKHEQHGIHVCYTPEDVEAHKLIGWMPLEETKLEETKPEHKPERKKPGRKPKAKQ